MKCNRQERQEHALAPQRRRGRREKPYSILPLRPLRLCGESPILVLVILALLAAPLSAAEIRVTSPTEIERATREAKAGDEIVIVDGTWKDAAITFRAKGTADKPITLRAATPGKVLLDGNSKLLIEGDHLTVTGVVFGDSDRADDVVQFKGDDNRLTAAAIITPHRGGKWVHLLAGRRNRLD